MGSSPQIFPATLRDLEPILEIEKKSFRNPFTRNLFEMEFRLEIAHLQVARLAGEVVGYIDFWHLTDEIHLINIAVHPDVRRQGVATALLNFMIGYADQHQVRQITLDVRVSNEAAIALYRRYRFETLSVRKRYYQDNDEDALVMALRL